MRRTGDGSAGAGMAQGGVMADPVPGGTMVARFGGRGFGRRCRCLGERFERRVLVLARVEQTGGQVVVRAVGIEAEAPVMDDAAQLELQLDRLQCCGRPVEAERRFDDLPVSSTASSMEAARSAIQLRRTLHT